jgi:hypothetical protein
MRALWLYPLFALVAAAQDAIVQENDGADARRSPLATDIYLPARDGRFPVVLVRTPYNKNGARSQCIAFAAKGYACVAQDCRGRFKSEGEFYAFVNEGKDGYDAIEWAARQPWSNGKVGTLEPTSPGTSFTPDVSPAASSDVRHRRRRELLENTPILPARRISAGRTGRVPH